MTVNKLYRVIIENDVIHFIVKSVCFLFIVFSLDLFIGKTLEYLYFRQESGLQYRTTYSMEKTEAEILILGSSRANRHYNPEILENKLNHSVYNTGRDASSIIYHLAILKAILKRHQPKAIILDLSGGEFKKNVDSYDRLSALLPYYEKHPEIQSIIELRGKYEKLKLLSSIYPYNSSLFTILIGNTEYNKIRASDQQGFMPLQKSWNDVVRTDMRSETYEVDSVKIELYENFIQTCLQSKIQLFIVSSPYLLPTDFRDHSIDIAEAIAQKNGVNFFDYSCDTTFVNKAHLFADLDHLNWIGADIFSTKVCDTIYTRLHHSQ